jgi:hypothetical protein
MGNRHAPRYRQLLRRAATLTMLGWSQRPRFNETSGITYKRFGDSEEVKTNGGENFHSRLHS